MVPEYVSIVTEIVPIIISFFFFFFFNVSYDIWIGMVATQDFCDAFDCVSKRKGI